MKTSHASPSKEQTNLQITYKQFCAVLREWDIYIWPEVKTMSRDISTFGVSIANQYGIPPGASSAEEMKLSKLAKALWKSLLVGADEVDRIHDEIFAEVQVEHFREVYSSLEKVVEDISNLWDPLEPPEELFIKLGKPARQFILRDGLLEKAIEAYKQAEQIKMSTEQAEVEARNEKLRKARERRASPDYIKPIGQKTRARIRALDNNQCVFCGTEVRGKNRYVRLSPNGYKVDDVILACESCAAMLKGKTPEQFNIKPKYGRYSCDSKV